MNQFCFLLGIMPRSGTNYLENIITLHDSCVHCGPVYEDFLVCESDALIKYAKKANKHWSPNWDPSKKHVTQDGLLKSIGYGLQQFLLEPKLNTSEDDSAEPLKDDDILVSKTPSVKSIHNFFRLFPKSKLIILIRDGRAVAESGSKSFNWDFEKASYDWSVAVKKINTFITENADYSNKIKLVKYESLINEPEKEVPGIFKFLEIDETNVSVDKIKNMHISGSSEQRNTNDSVNWKPVKMNDNFQPLKRFAHWSNFKKRRFEWLAGDSLIAMDYIESYTKFSPLETIMHTSLDITWPVRVLPRTVKYLTLHKNFILKTS